MGTTLFPRILITFVCMKSYIPSNSNTYKRALFILILVSVMIRTFLAWSVELGNDEVYYRVFGLFPSLSYFDHPPMVAWLIHLTTFGSQYTSEVLVRLSSIAIGAINTYLIYRLAERGQSGFIAALMYTGSIYASLIAGVFIMPDTPLTIFWLTTLLIFKDILIKRQTRSSDKIQSANQYKMILVGCVIGLAMLSKYTGLYLWAASGLYIILYNRKWLKSWSLYLAVALTFLVFAPVLIWNYQNDFISFTFHSARVTTQTDINWLYFGREFMGGFFYNNPINFIVIICAIIAYVRGNRYIERSNFRYLIWFSVPMIVLFWIISLTRETLPHWSGPAYFALIVLGAKWLNTLKNGVRIAYVSVIFTLIICLLGVAQINYSIISLGQEKRESSSLGRGDITLDMYGWRQLGQKFAPILKSDQSKQLVGEKPIIINYRWDESAHLDTYLALPLGLNMITAGEMIDTHFYDWINKYRGGLDLKDGGYLVLSTRYFTPNLAVFESLNIDPDNVDHSITITKKGDPMVNFYVYRIAPNGF